MDQGRCPVSITTVRRARSRIHASDAVSLHGPVHGLEICTEYVKVGAWSMDRVPR